MTEGGVTFRCGTNGGCTGNDAVAGQLGWNLEGLAHQGLILRVSAERMTSEGCEVESLVVAEPACYTDDAVCALPVCHAQVILGPGMKS